MKRSIIKNNIEHIPFDKLNKGSKIIIYGMGYMGRCCYNQIISSGYASVVGICDKNIKKKKYIKDINWISKEKIANEEYDFILITILNREIIVEIYNNLLRLGIPKNKILHMYMGYDFKKKLKVIEEKELARYVNNQINKMHKIAKRPEEYLLTVGEYIINLNYSFIKMKNIVKLLESELNRIIFLKYMYIHKLFDSECMKMYMKSLLNYKPLDDTLYGLVIDTTLMQFKYPQIVYEDFFKDRMKLQMKLCEYYSLNIEGNKKDINKTNSIAIVVQRFCTNDYWDATSKIAYLCAKELKKAGYEIKIFNLCSLQRANEQQVFLEYPSGMKKKDLTNYNKEKCDVEVYYPTFDDVHERLKQNIDAINDFSPDLIIDMADEMFIEGFVLNKKYYIVNIPMRIMSYSSFATRYVAFDMQNVKKDMKKYKSIDENKFVELKLSFTDIEECEDIYNRNDYGFSQEDFLIVTVGTRLKKEIDRKMVENMIAFLNCNKNAKWILVGDGKGEAFKGYGRYFSQKRIIEWGMEENLLSFYSMCDVYINPIRKGGGLSIRQAMTKGLPIVTCDFESDALIMMKDTHIVKGGYKEMMLYMEKLMNDSVFYKKIQDETIKQVNNNSVRKDVQDIVNIIGSEI